MPGSLNTPKKVAKLSIVPGPPKVMRVFELLGLQEEFPFEEGIDGGQPVRG